MKAGCLVALCLFLVACGNSVSGTLVGVGGGNDEGFYIEIDDEMLFVPNEIDPDGSVFDEGVFKVKFEEGVIEGETVKIVTAVVSKKDM